MQLHCKQLRSLRIKLTPWKININYISTYSIYGSTSSWFFKTYRCACIHFTRLSWCKIYPLPKARPIEEKMGNPSYGYIWSPSQFHLTRLNQVSIPWKYLEQNVKHSSIKYPFAIEPSGRVGLQTLFFSVCKYLSIRYIYWYWIGPTIIASLARWTGKCIITSKNDGGNVISN